MHRKHLLSLSLTLLLLFPLIANADDEAVGNRLHQILPAKQTIIIDGNVTDQEWSNAWEYSLDYEVEPSENNPAKEKTIVYITYDNKNLYVAIKCFDSNPDQIRANYCERDNIWDDDWAGIAIDTFNDQRRNYLFLVSPLGIQLDQIETTSGHSDWDGIWESAATIGSFGWSAELCIPFETIRFQGNDGPQTWGFDAIRGISRDYFRMNATFPRDRNDNCYRCQMIKIKGFKDVDPGRNLQVIPTITAHNLDERDELPLGEMQNTSRETDLGITANWGITPNMTLSGTINPDFSQVEADARQIDINEPFALFFPEKRPFFMEGADYFNTRINVLYTRMIREPQYGVKLTGKEGDNTFGAYFVEDDITNLIFPGVEGSDSTSIDKHNQAAVFRYKRDIGDKYTVGLIGSNRQGEDYYNRVFGVDGRFLINGRNRIDLQVLGSSTDYDDQISEEFDQPFDSFSGHALHLRYFYNSTNIRGWLTVREFSSDFRTDLGFVPRVGTRSILQGSNYTWLNDDSFWSMMRVGQNNFYMESEDGVVLRKFNELFFIIEGVKSSGIVMGGNFGKQSYEGKTYNLNEVFSRSWMRPFSNLAIRLNVDYGDSLDYANSRIGKIITLNPHLGWNISKNLFLNLNYTYENLKADAANVYKARVAQGVMTYHFSTRMSLRGIFQYVNYDYNVENYIEEQDENYEHLFTQLLFSYQINPQTVFFLGYTDNYGGTIDYNLMQENRTLFMKIGYSWQL